MKTIKSHFASESSSTAKEVNSNLELLNSGVEPPTANGTGSGESTEIPFIHSPSNSSPRLKSSRNRILNVLRKTSNSKNQPPPQTLPQTETKNETDSLLGDLLVGFPGSDDSSIPTITNITPKDTTARTTPTTPTSTPNTKNQKRLDQYGFITNLDNQGLLRDDLFPQLPGGAFTPSQNDTLPTTVHNTNNDPTSPGNNSTTVDTLVPLPPPISARELRLQRKLAKRREKKWSDMLAHWPSILASPPKYDRMRSRVRKGIPNSVRGEAWSNISKASQRVNETEIGVYKELIRRSCGGAEEAEEEFDGSKNWFDVDSIAINSARRPSNGSRSRASGGSSRPTTPDGVVMKETIERDINRTFPRHSMFYDSLTDTDSGESGEGHSTDTSYDRISEGDSTSGGMITTWDHHPQPPGNVGGGNDGADAVEVLADGQAIVPPSRGWSGGELGGGVVDGVPPQQGPGPSTKEAQLVVAAAAANRARMARMRKQREKVGDDLTVAKGGQAILRRVLRAYSIYDVDVGYCQGMNFIAAMFITYVSEEQAFWLLVAIMKDSPCRMRGLFGEGMSEAHQVLFVAQKLITQFLPKLSRHFESENVDITMFATQWLLTMYTSSFPFDIVTRIWDCFLVEGWKMTYRVMLALLEGASAELMKLRFEDILGYLKDLPHRVDVDELLESTFKIQLRKKHIAKYAKQWEKEKKLKEKKMEKEKKKLLKEKEKEGEMEEKERMKEKLNTRR